METNSLLQEIADSWFMLAMMTFFVGVVLFALRPGSKRLHDDIAQIPFRNDDPKE